MTESLRCLVLNAGGAYMADKAAAEAWVDALTRDTVARPDIAFIQEVPSERWLAVWERRGYRRIDGHPRGWKVRSALLTLLPAEELTALTVENVPELEYHGEYVAAGRLSGWADCGADLNLFSVHASPNPAQAQYLSHHPRARQLVPRDGGDDPRYRGQLFDADVLLDTIGHHHPVLACGDLNEARGWDALPDKTGQTWGQEFFGAPGGDSGLTGGLLQQHGLSWVCLDVDDEEVPTRIQAGHPELQLDHILISTELSAMVRDAGVDLAWSASPGAVAGLADHAPIWFTLRR